MSTAVPAAWLETLRMLPGYDPLAQAGDCYFDADAAEAACAFFGECIRHVKGKEAGQPFVLEPWQRAVVGNLFGWKRPDGSRRYRECFLYVAKKNGKTAFAAGLLLYVLACDGEQGAEVYSAAATRDQAALVFQHAAGMVRQEPELSRRLRIYGDKGGSQMRSIVVEDDPSSTYKCLASDANTADGSNPHFVIIDELHRHKTPELAEVLQKSTAARRQPLVIYTTTADYNRPSLCNTKLAYARTVRDNKGDPKAPGYAPSFLPVIYECHKDDDWKSPVVWFKANPNLGVTVTEDFLASECQKAQEMPTELNNFLRLHLNIVTDADEAWIPADRWDACGEAFDPAALEGRRAFGAFDLSSKVDLTAWVLLFPPTPEDEKYRLLCRFYVPAEAMHERERRDKVPYGTWARLGLLQTTPGDVIDYDFIEADVLADSKKYDVQEIAYDEWNATQTALHLQEKGLKMVSFGQGYKSMSEPAKEWEKLVIQGLLAHGGHQVLRWMMGNTMIERDPAGNIKPSKKRSPEKIDGVVAGVMALGRAMVTVNASSVYNKRGIEFV